MLFSSFMSHDIRTFLHIRTCHATQHSGQSSFQKTLDISMLIFFVNFMYMSWPSCTWGARRWWWGCRGARRPGTPRSRGRRTSASSQGSPDTCRVQGWAYSIALWLPQKYCCKIRYVPKLRVCPSSALRWDRATNQFLHYLFVTFSRGQTDETRNEHTMKIIQREEERRDSVLFWEKVTTEK